MHICTAHQVQCLEKNDMFFTASMQARTCIYACFKTCLAWARARAQAQCRPHMRPHEAIWVAYVPIWSHRAHMGSCRPIKEYQFLSFVEISFQMIQYVVPNEMLWARPLRWISRLRNAHCHTATSAVRVCSRTYFFLCANLVWGLAKFKCSSSHLP